MSNPAIQIQGLSKRYRISSRARYKALRDSLTDSFKGVFSNLRFLPRQSNNAQNCNEYIWALKDVSFDVQRGQVIGIVGRNGAGKSTLLKILSRVTEPTEGVAKVYGRVGSLLEVGTGFHAELTGRENIYLNGAILGMRRSEIARKFDSIVDFSGVGKFIDTPVKHYSSGMYVRLAFSVAVHLEPEILLVDEVLAVGDLTFQQKCLKKMEELAGGGLTVLLVSHNMGAIRSLCSRALLLNEGRVQAQGLPEQVVQAYVGGVIEGRVSGHYSLVERVDRAGHGGVRATAIQIGTDGNWNGMTWTGAETNFLVSYRAQHDRSLLRLHAALVITDVYGASVFYCSTAMTRSIFYDVPPVGGVVCKIKNLPLIPGRYVVSVRLKDDQASLADYVIDAARFDVLDNGSSEVAEFAPASWGSVLVPHEWEWLPSTDSSISHHVSAHQTHGGENG